MKTLTELSGTLVRMAAAAIAEARRSLPREEAPAPVVEATPAPQGGGERTPGEAAQGGAVDAAGVDATPVEVTSVDATPVEVPPAGTPVAPAKADPDAESDAVKAALDEAVAKATGVSGDRLAMLRAAVKAAGRRVDDVRLVRVFGREEPVSGGQIIGEHQYVVDLHPQSMRQVAGGREERGRGGRRGGGGGGGRGGGGGGGRGAKGSTTGGFSMDSLREDRKSERGGRGRPGGGRRPGGGGSGGRGGPGGPPDK